MRRIMNATDFSRTPTRSNKRKRKEESAYMKKMSGKVTTIFKKEQEDKK